MTIERVLEKLDEYLHKNDYASAEKHLLSFLDEAESVREEIPLLNELMGLYRKLGRESEAISTAERALSIIDSSGIAGQVGAATTYLNSATVYKAFGKAEKAIPLFERARKIYENSLPESDSRLGGLYNNMALALVDEKRFNDAKNLYEKAIFIMERNGSLLEVAITYLNIASAIEEEKGLVDGEREIEALLALAEKILEEWQKRDGYYAFVCEKCASVFGYYGHFYFENELNERAKRIYEGS